MTSSSSQHSERNFYQEYKKIIIPFGVVIFLAILLFVAVRYIESTAEKQLLEMANRELAPNAKIEIQDFSLGLLPPRIHITGIRLIHEEPFEDQTPSKPLDTIRHLEVRSAELSGINLFKLIRGTEWGLGNFTIDGLDLEMVPTTSDRLTDSSPLEHPLDVTISQVNINDGTFKTFPSRNSETARYHADGIYLDIENISITDPENPLHTYFDHFKLEVANAEQVSDDGNYKLRVENFLADSRDELLSLQFFEAKPQSSAYEISADFGKQHDIYTIEGGPFTFSGFKLIEWFEYEDIWLSYAEINDLSLIIEREKSFERGPRNERPLPNRQLKDLPFSVKADSLRWVNGKVSYTEQHSEDNRSGTILFTDINLLIESLQNSDENEVIPVTATSRFMDSSELSIEFEFYADDTANHRVKASLSEMNLKDVNNPLENLAGIRVREGNLTQLDFTFHADDYRSEGDLRMIYSDLSLRLLDEETMEEDRGTRFRSFFANTFAVRSDNNSEDPRIGAIDFDREKERSIFNFWWNSIKTGLEDTVRR